MSDIELRIEQRVAVISLNRPERRNAVSLAMWRRLPEIFQELDRDPAVRGVILTGAGGHFCAGADISEFSEVRASIEQATAYEVAVDDCCDAISAAAKPTIAAVEGFCMGGGVHLAMSCDFRYAAPTATFAIPAARLSIVYGVSGTRKLLSLVGVSRAKRLLYSAERLRGEQALRIGLVDELADEPLAAAQAFALRLADNAPLSIAGAKALLNGLVSGDLDPRRADALIERAVGSDDYREGRSAFVEKRPPSFRGQ